MKTIIAFDRSISSSLSFFLYHSFFSFPVFLDARWPHFVSSRVLVFFFFFFVVVLFLSGSAFNFGRVVKKLADSCVSLNRPHITKKNPVKPSTTQYNPVKPSTTQ